MELVDWFHTHISVHGNFKEKGLGTFLYLLAAKEVYRAFDSQMSSTSGPSWAAILTLRKMENLGWVKTIQDPFFYDPLRRQPPGVVDSVFHFQKKVLSTEEFDELDAWLEGRRGIGCIREINQLPRKLF